MGDKLTMKQKMTRYVSDFKKILKTLYLMSFLVFDHLYVKLLCDYLNKNCNISIFEFIILPIKTKRLYFIIKHQSRLYLTHKENS